MTKETKTNWVTLDSGEFADQIGFLQAIKQHGPAKTTKICITCWQIVTITEPSHTEHILSGTFATMQLATKLSIE